MVMGVKKNNKGFTLIELLAVIVILAAIMLIIIPLVTNNVREGSEAAVMQNEESIEMAAENWASDNKNYLPEKGNSICISVGLLVQEGYLDNNVPDEYANGSVVIANNEGVYYYNFQEIPCDEGIGLDRKITFDFETNNKGGGQQYAYYLPGDSVTLIEGKNKRGYDFVGWNTNPNAHSSFEEYTMPTSDVTLYAIYKKDLDIDFIVQKHQDTVIAKADKDKASCTMYNNEKNCTITAPTLTSVAGTNMLGWNTDKDAKVATVKSGANINVSNDDPYYSIVDVLDKTAPDCNLSIISGTKGENDWYNSNVTIRMTSSDSGGSNLTDYGITTSSTATYNSSASVIHSADGKDITYYGYVKDGVGNTNKCSVSFKKDSTSPTITSVTNSSGGNQTGSNVTISAKASDATSEMNRISYRYSTTGTEYNDWSQKTATEVKGTWTAEQNRTVYIYAYDNAGNSTYKSAGKVHIVKDSNFRLYANRDCSGDCNVPGTNYWNDRLWRFWWSGANTGINRGSFSLKYSTPYITNYCTWNNGNLPFGSRSRCGYVKFNSNNIYFSRSFAQSSIVVRLCTNGGVCKSVTVRN